MRRETTPNTSPEIASKGVLARTRYRQKRTGFGILVLTTASSLIGAGCGIIRSLSTTAPILAVVNRHAMQADRRPDMRTGLALSAW